MVFVVLMTSLVLTHISTFALPSTGETRVDLEMSLNLSHLISEESITSMLLYIILSGVTETWSGLPYAAMATAKRVFREGCVCAL